MNKIIKKQLIWATIVYWILLLYIIAALVFWFLELQQQNGQMTNYRLLELHSDDPAYLQKVETVNNEQQRKTAQYIGEGSMFLLLILVGAVFVYRAVRKQFKSSEQQQNFMMAVTHELKTPIAVIKLNLETMQKHRLEEGRQQKILMIALEETDRLNSLANNILIFVRVA